MNGAKASRYEEKIRRVCDYINQHLDEEFSLEQLSRLANFSKFHFNRQFAEYTGISVFRFIQLMRLKRASYRLAFVRQDRVIDIALDAGFENPESFSRAFKHVFGQTPSQFRKQAEWPSWHSKYQFAKPEQRGVTDVEINIIEFVDTNVAILEHRGSVDRVNESVGKFIEWRKESKLSPVKSSRTFGVAYDDPETTEPEKFRFDICATVDGPVPENSQGVKAGLIPGGRCAVTRHVGSHDRIGDSVHYLYGKWLPQSGEQLRDFPCFFHYLNLITEVSEHELLTDVYLPLK